MEAVETEEKPWFSDGLRFKCTGCGKCCTGSSGYVYLSEGDILRLSEHLHLSPAAFVRKYTRLVEGQYALLDRPGSPDCIFLHSAQCAVYDARPTQCRTYPWWVHHLKEPKDWEKEAARCEGINHPEAPLVSSLVIQEQCLSYLDNILEQNFNNFKPNTPFEKP